MHGFVANAFHLLRQRW